MSQRNFQISVTAETLKRLGIADISKFVAEPKLELCGIRFDRAEYRAESDSVVFATGPLEEHEIKMLEDAVAGRDFLYSISSEGYTLAAPVTPKKAEEEKKEVPRLPLLPEDLDPEEVKRAHWLWHNSFMALTIPLDMAKEATRFGVDQFIQPGDLCVFVVKERIGPYVFLDLLKIGHEDVQQIPKEDTTQENDTQEQRIL